MLVSNKRTECNKILIGKIPDAGLNNLTIPIVYL